MWGEILIAPAQQNNNNNKHDPSELEYQDPILIEANPALNQPVLATFPKPKYQP